MIQVFNFLLIASNHLPSLGILIETISASKEDLFMFFCFSQLIFFMAVVGFYYLFGFKDHYFDTMMRSYTTLCQMLNGGRIPYAEMYKADPKVAAIAATLFTFLFVLFFQYFVVSIVIRTYILLRDE